MDIEEVQKEIIEEFSKLEDWLDKYEHIISLGKALPKMAEELRNDENSISGCQSQVWIKGVKKDGKISFLADSDALITRGIIALLLRAFNKQTPEDIANTDLYFIDQIGLSSNLSPSRANGLASILNKIRSYGK